MKLRFFQIVTMFLVSFGFLGASFSQSLMASEIQEINHKILNLSELDIKYLDKFVESNENGFYIVTEGYKELNSKQLKILEDQLTVTNNSFESNKFEKKGKTFTNTKNDNEVISQPKAGYKNTRGNGKTTIKFYWWGFKAYISKGVIKAAGSAGIGAAGFLASKLNVATWIGAVIAAGIGLLGYSLTDIPYGVGLRYTYGLGTTAVWWQ